MGATKAWRWSDGPASGDRASAEPGGGQGGDKAQRRVGREVGYGGGQAAAAGQREARDGGGQVEVVEAAGAERHVMGNTGQGHSAASPAISDMPKCPRHEPDPGT